MVDERIMSESKQDDGQLHNTADAQSNLPSVSPFSSSLPLVTKGKLYCRSIEESELIGAYKRVRSSSARAGSPRSSSSSGAEFVIINGATGTGKSTLAQSIRRLVADDGGFFIEGKFDQLESPEPFSAFVRAFTEFTTKCINRGPQFTEKIRRKIRRAMTIEDKRILTNMIPALNQIVGQLKPRQNSIQYSSTAELHCNRISFVFLNFLKAICDLEHPLVFFLDDLHWADESSLDLIGSLMTESVPIEGILFLGTCRDVENKDQLKVQVRNLLTGNESVIRTKISLGNLPITAVQDMLQDLLSVRSLEELEPLIDVIYQQTEGNIFFVEECLRSLEAKGLLRYQKDTREWMWDKQEIRLLVDYHHVSELILDDISQLDPSTQELLKVASCLGSKVDESLLQRVRRGRPVAPHLKTALTSGFLVRDRVLGGYRFTHDCIQEATYMLVSMDERASFHLGIGRSLWKSFDDIEELEKHIFIILGQIRLGGHLIKDQNERDKVANLCLRAGERAIKSSSFHTSSTYLLLGIAMLGSVSWERNYELTHNLYNAAMEVEYVIGNFENVDRLTKEILENSATFLDTMRARSVQVHCLGTRQKTFEAVKSGLDTLEALGERFPSNPSILSLTMSFARTRWRLRGRSTQSLARMKSMEDVRVLSAMQMLNVVYLYALKVKPLLAPLIALRMVNLTLRHGLSANSCFGFGIYGALLCG
jgi:predicted ATPase